MRPVLSIVGPAAVEGNAVTYEDAVAVAVETGLVVILLVGLTIVIRVDEGRRFV